MTNRTHIIAQRVASSSTAALAFLRKASKGIRGQFSIDVVKEAFQLLDGWSISETTAAQLFRSSDQIKRLFKSHFPAWKVTDCWGYGGSKEPKEFWFVSQENAEHGRREFLKVVEQVGPKGPTSPQVGQCYIHGDPVVKHSNPNERERWMAVLPPMWLGVQAWTVVAPSASGVVPLAMSEDGRFESSPEAMNVVAFWTFCYKNGLKEAATAAITALGSDEVEKALRPPSARSLENTGTCPACFNNVKLSRETIMRHGWEVQGTRNWGSYGSSWHTGACFGYGYEPFEVSKKGTEEFLAIVVLPTRDQMETQFATLVARPEVLTVQGVRQVLEVPKSDPQYEWRLKEAIRNVEYDLKGIEAKINELKRYITEWVLKPLP